MRTVASECMRAEACWELLKVRWSVAKQPPKARMDSRDSVKPTIIVWPGWLRTGFEIPLMSREMKALIRKTTSRSSSSVSVAEPTQHWTSLGPGQRFLTKEPLQPVPALRQMPLWPEVSVHDLLRQYLTLAGSLGQYPATVKPRGCRRQMLRS